MSHKASLIPTPAPPPFHWKTHRQSWRFVRDQNRALISAVDEFCCRCRLIPMAELPQVAGCEVLECPLHCVRWGSKDRRTGPSPALVRSINAASERAAPPKHFWSATEDHSLMDWRSQKPPRQWWWIALQLRRPEASVRKRHKLLSSQQNPINPLEQAGLA